jgi:hypothetical protein
MADESKQRLAAAARAFSMTQISGREKELCVRNLSIRICILKTIIRIIVLERLLLASGNIRGIA